MLNYSIGSQKNKQAYYIPSKPILLVWYKVTEIAQSFPNFTLNLNPKYLQPLLTCPSFSSWISSLFSPFDGSDNWPSLILIISVEGVIAVNMLPQIMGARWTPKSIRLKIIKWKVPHKSSGPREWSLTAYWSSDDDNNSLLLFRRSLGSDHLWGFSVVDIAFHIEQEGHFQYETAAVFRFKGGSLVVTLTDSCTHVRGGRRRRRRWIIKAHLNEWMEYFQFSLSLPV